MKLHTAALLLAPQPQFTVEELTVELEQARNSLEFLYGCLTEPKTFKFAYPEMTAREIRRLGKIVGASKFCVHSRMMSGCEGCEQGHKARVLRAQVSVKIGER